MQRFAIAINKPRAIPVVAGGIFACFATYAFLSPTTYETSTLVLVETAEGALVESTMPADAAASKLRNAVLGSAKLAANLGTTGKAVEHVAKTTKVETKDARTFVVSYRNSEAAPTQEICNLLARVAVEEAPRVLDPPKLTAPQAKELAREKRLEELAAFVAAHPELTSEAPVAPVDAEGKREPDTLLLKLQAEYRMIQEMLAKREVAAASDNPYEEAPKGPDTETLKRRQVEVNEAILERRKALEGKPTPLGAKQTKLTPELQAEWKAKLRAVAEAGGEPTTAETAPQLLSARLLGEAPLPTSPVKPNRPLVLFLGAVSSLFVAVALWTAKAARRRRPSDQPLPTALSPTTDPPSRADPADLEAERVAEGEGAPGEARSPEPAAAVTAEPDARAEPDRKAETAARRRRMAQTQISGSPPSAPGGTGSAQRPDTTASAAAEPSRADTATQSEEPSPPHRGILRNGPAAEELPPEGSWEPESRPPVTQKVFGGVVAEPAGRWDDTKAEEQPKASMRRIVNVGGQQVSSTDRPLPRTDRKLPPAQKQTMPFGSPDRSEAGMHRESSRPSPPPEHPTSYRFTSNAPPPNPSPAPDHTVVSVYDVPPNWSPDPSLEPEARRQLGNQLFPFAVERCFCLLVTSLPSTRAEKSQVAAELALALAETGHPRILLMEGNFHRPSIHRLMHLDVPIPCGYSQQLHARVHGEPGGSWTVIGCSGSLHVLAEGAMRSPGILLSKQFEKSLDDLKTYYDIIVIDGPVASADVDCRALDSAADGLVMVGNDPESPKVEEAVALFGHKRFATVVAV